MEAILVKTIFNPADNTVNRTEERTWYEFAAAELLKKLGEHWEDRITISDNDKNAYLDTAGEGYEFNRVYHSSLTISVDSSNNIINAVITNNLSASGSINFPKSVTKLCFLAICPSKKSVNDATANKTNIIKF